jgi:eukaryotic-like serine/threonine-protein kinase
MSSLLGTRIGPYQVAEIIGAGGMGEVYRARDSRLNREVALKVLPEAFARDAERLARFKREAQVLASLNHPNIAAIYGFEECADVQALALELVDGPTLADVVARGALPVADVLHIARQIAEALEAAHERGVIHRDLKPANIKLRDDGAVKVLDFGLAKALASGDAGAEVRNEGSAAVGTMQATITSPAMTMQGVVLGTAAYMSPEQAKGRPADKRSDIWAFGCVLFEMLARQRPFDGDDVADTLAYVLTREPTYEALPPETPDAIRRLIRRCLQKDRRRRLADIADARLELEEALTPEREHLRERRGVIERTVQEPAPRRIATRASLIAAGVLTGALLTAICAWLWISLRPAPHLPTVRFEIAAPEQTVFFRGGNTVSVSPDGANVAFLTGDNRTESRIWLRAVNTSAARVLPGTEEAVSPVWSPDGRAIVFGAGVATNKLRIVDVGGGPPLTIGDGVAPGAWGPNGLILFTGTDRRLYSIPSTGGDPVALTTLDDSQQEGRHVGRFWLPDGRRFVFSVESLSGTRSALYIGSRDSPERTKLTESAFGGSYAGGFLFYAREQALTAQRFDADAGRLDGAPLTLVENISAFSVSPSGVLAYTSGDGSTARGFTWTSLDGKALEAVPSPGIVAGLPRPRLSPDARQIAFTRVADAARRDVWLLDVERKVPTRLTTDEASSAPLWSPDGKRLVYTSTRNSAGDLVIRDLSSNRVEPLVTSNINKTALAWSPDGRYVLFSQMTAGIAEIWAVPVDRTREPFAIVKTGFPAGFPTFSPDGKWFAYCEGDSGPDQVYAQPFPPNGTRIRISSTSGASPQWSADGKQILYTSTDDELMIVDVAQEGGTLRVGTPRALFRTLATFLHRGVLFDSPRKRVLLRDVPEAAKRPVLSVVVNWLPEVNAAFSR